jgi:adenine deaminase
VLGYLQNLELGLASTPGALTGPDLFETLDWPECVALEEPPYIPLMEKDPFVVRLVEQALARGKVVMGHGAGLEGNDLVAYTGMGVTADHETVSAEEAVERVRLGVMVSMRECSLAPNQRDVQRAVTDHGCDPAYFMFCSDVPDAHTLARVGHIDQSIRVAVEGGIDPIVALQMATVNAARYYRVDEDLGSVAPGRQADLLLVGDLARFDVQSVIVRGEPVVLDGDFVARLERPTYPEFLKHTVALARPVTPDDLRLEAPAGRTEVTVRVIGGEQLVSDERHVALPVVDGTVGSDTDRDVLKLAMFDRYGRWEEPAIAFLQGFGLMRGAIGTSYNPFYNNVMVLGVDDGDMAVAANEVNRLGGGFVAVADGQVLDAVALPLCGLLSDETVDVFVDRLERLYETVAGLGCTMPSPYHYFAFTAVVGELPFLKMSDRGPFDVVKRKLLSTIVEDAA